MNAPTQKCSPDGDAPKIVLRCKPTPTNIRVLEALLEWPLSREEVDRIGRVSNGPQLMMEFRDAGLTHKHLPCKRRALFNSDGAKTYPGVYWLTAVGRAAVLEWFAQLAAS